MAISKIKVAPYRQDTKAYVTPLVTDVLFSETRDCTRADIPPYGTPHPDTTKWPKHKLVYVQQQNSDREGVFDFFYAADRPSQDEYNYVFGQRELGGRLYRSVSRVYVTPRSKAKTTSSESFGDPMPGNDNPAFDGVQYVFFDKELQKTDTKELDSLYVTEVKNYLDEIVLSDVTTLGTEKSDPVPDRFKTQTKTVRSEYLATGKISQPTLGPDEYSAKQDQINDGLKRVIVSGRDSTGVTDPLSGFVATNELQGATVTESIVPETTKPTLSARTIEAVVEPLGNGQSLQKVTTVDSLFERKLLTTERPDPLPAKFRADTKTFVTRSDKEGVVTNAPVLATNEFSATVEQVNEFVYREQRQTREAAGGKVLNGLTTTNNLQLATVTESIVLDGTIVQPTATTVEATVEPLGDGTSLQRVVEVPQLFTQAEYSVEKPDVVPDKFKGAGSSVTTEINAAGQAAQRTLTGSQLSASEAQVNALTKRTQIVSRNYPDEVTLVGQRSYVEGGAVANVTEKLLKDPPEAVASGLNVVEAEYEQLSDGRYVERKVEVESWPVLTSSDWDNELNLQVVRTEQIVAPPSQTDLKAKNTSYRALNKDRVVKTVESPSSQEVLAYKLGFPTEVNLQLPDVLKSVTVVWSIDNGVGQAVSDSFWSRSGYGSISPTESLESTGSCSIRPELVVEIERPWGSEVPATAWFFYAALPTDGHITETDFLNRLSTISGQEVKRWPTFKPKAHVVTLQGSKKSATAKYTMSYRSSVSFDGIVRELTLSKSNDVDSQLITDSLAIQPVIHGNIPFFEKTSVGQLVAVTDKTETVRASTTQLSFQTEPNNTWDAAIAAYKYNDVSAPVVGTVEPKSLSATTPAAIPNEGLYMLQSRVEPYKWGYVRCFAVVFDAANLST